MNHIRTLTKSKLLSVLLACGIISACAWALDVFAFRLVGRVEHSETLPPLATTDDLGKVFESTGLYKAMIARAKAASSRRFLVPSWLAGTWQRERATETSRVQLPSGKRLVPEGQGVAAVTDKFGTYRDALGMVWQVFDAQHSSGQIDRGEAVDFHVVTDYQLVPLGQNMAIVMVQAAHAVVDKKTKKLTSAYRDEELNTYSMIDNELIKTDSSVKVFDIKGHPRFLTRAVSTERRIAPFVEAGKETGQP